MRCLRLASVPNYVDDVALVARFGLAQIRALAQEYRRRGLRVNSEHPQVGRAEIAHKTKYLGFWRAAAKLAGKAPWPSSEPRSKVGVAPAWGEL